MKLPDAPLPEDLLKYRQRARLGRGWVSVRLTREERFKREKARAQRNRKKK